MRDNDKIAIEEMANAMCGLGESSCQECAIHWEFVTVPQCDLVKRAGRLYSAGYRRQREAEWISVDERLPESDTRCIVWSFDYIWHIRFASYNSGAKRWYVVCGGEIKDTKRDGVKVTHWMPLPEPPDMKGGE